MIEQRRQFLKTTLGAGIAGVSTFLAAKYSMAQKQKEPKVNCVENGRSPKEEILYKKTAEWEAYYRAAY